MDWTQIAIRDMAPGVLWQPWWVDPRFVHLPNPKRPDLLGMIYRVRRHVMVSVDNVAPSSELYDVDGKDFDLFLRPNGDETLLKDIEANGQRDAITVINDSKAITGPIKTCMFSDPALRTLQIFHGHHRYAIAKHLRSPLKADVVDVMLFPRDWWKGRWKDIYNHVYDDSFWTLPQTDSTKKPWFIDLHFDDLHSTHKGEPLWECLRILQGSGAGLSAGIDYGCAEGAYGWHVGRLLGIPMIGMDVEPARVLRAQIRKAATGKGIVAHVQDFNEDWEDPVPCDFGMCLSVSHWMKDWPATFSRMSRGKKVMIVEVRTIGANRRAHEEIFANQGFKHTLVTVLDKDRHFFVLRRA